MNLQDLQDEIIHGFTVTAERKRINLVYIDLLQEFDRLCQKNNITYWVYFGTLLGAVRHQGFIPWDDDVDIMMPRKDFDRLMAMSNEEFGAKEPYFLQNIHTDPTYSEYLQRFRRSDTTAITQDDLTCLREHPKRAHYNMGLDLSIFPLDDCPSTNFAFQVRKKLAYFVMGVEYRAGQPACDKPLMHAVCDGIHRLLGPHFFVRTVYALFRVKKTKSPMVTCLDGFYPDPHYWHREDFRETVMLPFENIQVRAPIGYDRLLTERYGNYREFPPVVERTEKHDCYMNTQHTYKDYLSDLDSIPL
jgi:lipopolysaccharide cholinephosphotransferase